MADPEKKISRLSTLQLAYTAARLRNDLRNAEVLRSEPIAIIGMACRFPGGADTPEAYWKLLEAGESVLGPTPSSRWNHADFFSEDKDQAGRLYTTRAGWLDGDVFAFDHEFFGISALEAAAMDPQQRLLLEIAWEALENAGIPAANLKESSTGVFMGVGLADYAKTGLRSDERETITPYSLTGSQFSVAAGRLSYFLGLRGPSLALDTACSSSLAAVHLAVRSLRGGECSMALAGGVNLMLSPEADIALSRAGVLSPSGACRGFDASADGYARGEGCGVFVLKRLADAIHDDNRILAVIRGSAMNHNGPAAGLTVPSADAQAELIGAALADSGVGPEQLSYLEAHGTGTPLGDPLEAKAAARALTRNRSSQEPLLLGTAKATIGHLETAAGAAGLMKLVLALRRRRLPPQAEFKEPNPRIDWRESGLRVEAKGRDWDFSERRIAGVSSFGIGGTNVHVLVEEAPELHEAGVEKNEADESPILLPLSAQSEQSLRQRVEDISGFIRRDPAGTRKLARFLAHRGNHGEHRLACAGRSPDEILAGLEAIDDEQPGLVRDRAISRAPSAVFVYAGQSPGRSFALAPDDIPGSGGRAFREIIEQCDSICRSTAGWSLIEFMSRPDSRADRTEFTQPALFALQIALTAWWREVGIRPGAVLGHSAGEIAAAHVAGVLELEEALRLILHRGRLMEGGRGRGGMIAAAISLDEAKELPGVREGALIIAARNAPRAMVLSGTGEAIDEFEEYARRENVFTKRLASSYAFHGPSMEEARIQLPDIIRDFNFRAPRLPLYSGMMGASLVAPPDAEYFGRQMVEPVLFAEAAAGIPRGQDVFIEMSPRPSLVNHIADIRPGALAVTSLRPDLPHDIALYRSLGALYAGGFAGDPEKTHPGPLEHVDLPPYPWNRVHLRQGEKPGPGRASRPPTAVHAAPVKVENPARNGSVQDYVSMLSRHVREILRSPEDSRPDPERGFFQMGMDSMTAVRLARLVSRDTGRELPRSLIFQHGNIRALARHLAEMAPAPEVSHASTVQPSAPGKDAPEPVAIIGMACRFPGGADSPEKFWELLRDGVEAVDEFPPRRLDLERFHDERPGTPGKVVARRAALLDNIDEFDAEFFSISPREAMAMDPQQRMLLETSWEALENAGTVPAELRESSTGVFVGITTNDYFHLQAARGDLNTVNAYSASGTLHSVAAGRISYVLGLRGPSMAVDTACSSALTAVHLACESLRRGESDTALAGGVNLILSPESTVSMSMLRALSPRGRCRTFDASADGYVRGEGCGMIVLKTMSAALRDGDEIVALIRGSRVNHDGPASGLTVPSGAAQADLLREGLRVADIAPHEVDYIEAHGTGTPLGDPVEFNSIVEVYGKDEARARPLLVGSVKTNIGHLESAAGIAGLFKVVLSLRHEAIPPHLHLRELNPDIHPESIPARIPRELTEWPAGDKPRIAGLNSFGMSGTNAHLLFQDFPGNPAPPSDESSEGNASLLPLSARSEPALRAMAANVRDLLNDEDSAVPSNLSYTAAVHKEHHEYRLAAVASSSRELRSMLDAVAQGREIPGVSRGRARPGERLVFVFSGQGSQWEGMGRELLQNEREFRETLEKCDAALNEFADWSLFDALRADDPAYMHRVEINQPVLFALQYSIASLWRLRGLEPAAVMGQSMGEVAAAAFADILPLQEAMRVITLRSSLLSRRRERGAMLLLRTHGTMVRELLEEQGGMVEIAMELSPDSSIVSGPQEQIQAVRAVAESRRIPARRIRVTNAGHTRAMDEFQHELMDGLRDLEAREAKIPFYSTTDAALMEGPELTPSYWWRNLRNPVAFLRMTKLLLRNEFNLFLEISPHPVVVPSLMETFHSLQARHAVAVPSLIRNESEPGSLLSAAGRLYTAGCSINWRRFLQSETNRTRMALPAYPWQRKRYWLPGGLAGDPTKVNHSPLGPALEPVHSPGLKAAMVHLDLERLEYLNDHRVLGTPVLPAAMYLDLAAEAFNRESGKGPVRLEEVRFLVAFPLNSTRRDLQLSLFPAQNGRRRFEFHGRAQGEDKWVLHAEGFILRADPMADEERPSDWAETGALSSASDFAPDEFYGALARIGMEYGPSFRGIESLAFARGDSNRQLVHAVIRAPDSIPDDGTAAIMHPALLDACLHAQAAVVSSRDDVEAVLPTAIESITLSHSAARTDRILVRAGGEITDNDRYLRGEVVARTAEGEIAFTARGLTSRLLPRDTDAELDSWTYDTHWVPADTDRDSPLERGDWIIWSDESIGPAVAERITARGGRVLLLRRADSSHRPPPTSQSDGAREIFIDLNSPGDANLLRKETADFRPAGILHLWSLTESLPDDINASTTDLCLSLRSALTSLPESEPADLLIVTMNAEQVTGEDTDMDLMGAALRGLGRVARNEFVGMDTRLIDLSRGPGPREQAENLYRAATSKENEVALRQGEFLTPRMRRLPFGEQLPRESWTVSEPSTVLITGGLGGLGLRAAEFLSAAGVTHIVLAGRSSPTPEALQTIEVLLARRTSVRVINADVSNADEVRNLVELAEKDAPPLKGVLHLAGILKDGLLTRLNREDFQVVTAPKIQGTLNLARALEGRELDFFILFSSAVTLLGTPGQGNYAAANAFLDAFARAQFAAGRPCLSISWGPFAEAGLAAQDGRIARRLAGRGMEAIPGKGGTRALERFLAALKNGLDRAHFALMPFHVDAWCEFHPRAAASSLLRDVARKRASEPREIRSILRERETDAERLSVLTDHLRAQAALILRMEAEQIAHDQTFGSLGFDSLTTLEMRNRLNESLGLNMPAAVLWNHPTPEALARHLMETLGFATPDPFEAPGMPAAHFDGEELNSLSTEEIANLLRAELNAGPVGIRDEG